MTSGINFRQYSICCSKWVLKTCLTKKCRYYPDTSWLRLYIHKGTYECTSDPFNYRECRKQIWESIDKIKEDKGIEPKTQLPEQVWSEIVFTPGSVVVLIELAQKDGSSSKDDVLNF